MLRGLIARLVALGVLMGGGGDAAAGGWTLPAGDIRAYLSLEVREAPARFDAAGRPADARRLSGHVSSTLEYGLLDWLTVGVVSETRAAALDAPGPDGADARAFDEAERAGYARVRLFAEGGAVASVQLGYSRAADYAVVRGAEIGDGADEIDLRLGLGRGFAAGPALGWVGAEAAYRARFPNARDQLRLDLTLGLRPRAAPRFLAMGQVFATAGALGRGSDDYDLLKLAPSVGVELGDRLTVVVGSVHEVWGRNVERGDSVSLQLWLRY